MTTREAVFKLIEYRRMLERNSEIDAEPFDMAIEALKAQRDEIDCKYCVYINPRTCECDNFICKKYKRSQRCEMVKRLEKD